MNPKTMMALLAGLGESIKPDLGAATRHIGDPYPEKKPVQMVNRPHVTKLTNHERVFYGRLARKGTTMSEKDIIAQRNK